MNSPDTDLQLKLRFFFICPKQLEEVFMYILKLYVSLSLK